jgi:DNA-binding transcriptional ArsR family regulator
MLSVDKLKKIRKTFNAPKESLITSAFKALGDINRHRIFQLLSLQQKMSASDIAQTLKLSRPLTSQHLKILEQSKLFKKEKIGQHKFYQLNRQNPLVPIFIKTLEKIK